MAKKEICEHDWQPVAGKFSVYKPGSGMVHTPVKCSKCGAERNQIADVLKKNKKKKKNKVKKNE